MTAPPNVSFHSNPVGRMWKKTSRPVSYGTRACEREREREREKKEMERGEIKRERESVCVCV